MSALSRIFRSPAATLLPLCLVTATAWAAPVKVQMQITGYVISADLDPAVNRLTATADVTFTALEELSNPTFELKLIMFSPRVLNLTQPTVQRSC